jgi:hypothetical protein
MSLAGVFLALDYAGVIPSVATLTLAILYVIALCMPKSWRA